MTIEDLAVMVAKGFDNTATKFDFTELKEDMSEVRHELATVKSNVNNYLEL